jgi:SsrA-binding protein
VLQGTEVKSLREGKANLQDSFARIDRGEMWLHNLHISPYEQGNRFNHDPFRTRKLLLHRQELRKLVGKVEQKGLTLVPLDLHFRRGVAKVTLALVRGKKLHDKREDIKKRDAQREMSVSRSSWRPSRWRCSPSRSSSRRGWRGRAGVSLRRAGGDRCRARGRGPGCPRSARHAEKDVTLAVARDARRWSSGEDPTLEVRMTRDRDTLIALRDRSQHGEPLARCEWRGVTPGAVHVDPRQRAPARRRRAASRRSSSPRRRRRTPGEWPRWRTRRSSTRSRPRASRPAQLHHARPPAEPVSARVRDWAEMIQRRLASSHPGPNRGVKQAGFVVLNGAFMPAVLVELGFISNAEEERMLATRRRSGGWRASSPPPCTTSSPDATGARSRTGRSEPDPSTRRRVPRRHV